MTSIWNSLSPTATTRRNKKNLFLVDTGATRAWIPTTIADELGIQPADTVALELADGTVKQVEYGFCLFSYHGETAADTVVLGPPGIEPLLGNLVLQDLRFVFDMERHTISRRHALKAKKISLE